MPGTAHGRVTPLKRDDFKLIRFGIPKSAIFRFTTLSLKVRRKSVNVRLFATNNSAALSFPGRSVFQNAEVDPSMAIVKRSNLLDKL